MQYCIAFARESVCKSVLRDTSSCHRCIWHAKANRYRHHVIDGSESGDVGANLLGHARELIIDVNFSHHNLFKFVPIYTVRLRLSVLVHLVRRGEPQILMAAGPSLMLHGRYDRLRELHWR